MTFPDVAPELKAHAPAFRGRVAPNASLADLTWFRVGGPAQALVSPADEDDLAPACLPRSRSPSSASAPT